MIKTTTLLTYSFIIYCASISVNNLNASPLLFNEVSSSINFEDFSHLNLDTVHINPSERLNRLGDNISVVNFNKTIGISAKSLIEIDATISLYSILGEEVFKQEQFKIKSSTHYLSAELSSGVYIIKIETEKYGSLVKKVILN